MAAYRATKEPGPWGMDMRRFRVVVGFFCALLLVSCRPPATAIPIGTTAGLGADPALLSTWIARGDLQAEKPKGDGVVTFHFLQIKDSPTLSVLWVATGSDRRDNDWMTFTGSTAKLGANRYLNAAWTGENGQAVEGDIKSENFPVLYSFGPHGRLTLYLLDEDKIKEAVKAGRIAGTVDSGNYDDVTITAGAAELDAFFSTPDAAKLFKTFVVLERPDEKGTP